MDLRHEELGPRFEDRGEPVERLPLAPDLLGQQLDLIAEVAGVVGEHGRAMMTR